MKIERHRAETGGPAIVSRRGAWTYSDPAVHECALRLHLDHGINVAELDDWIEGEAWPDAEQLQRVLAWRQRMLRAACDDAAEGWGMYLLTLAAMNMRERFLHPLALVGKEWGHKLPARGERKTIRAPKQSTLERKARNQRIVALRAAGKTVAEIARGEGLSVRQVLRILGD